MNRPCFALSILFAALTGSLLVVGSAKSQTGVDSADASRAASPAAVGQCTPPEAGRCVVQAAPADDASLPEDYSRYLDDYRYYLDGFDSRSRQWTMVAPTPIESVATTATASERTIPLRSEHDTTYDQAVYGPALPVAAEVAEKVAVEVTAGGERQPSYEEAEMPFEHVYDCYEYGYAATPDPEAGFSDRAQPQTAVDVAASAGQASNYEDGYDGCYDAYSYEDWSYEDYSSEDYSDEYTYEDNWYESYTYEDYGYEPAVAEVDAADEAEGEAPAAVADAEVERSPCNGYSDDDAYLCECEYYRNPPRQAGLSVAEMLDVTEAVSAAVARSLPLDNLQAARRSVQQWAAGTQRAAARVDLAATLERLAAQAATARASETAAEDLAAELDELYPAGGFDYERYSGCWSDPPVAVIAGSQASQAMQRSLHESCSRPMLQAMAQVLSQAGSALQDASRQLTQLAGDEPVEIARHRSANDTPR